MATFINPTDTGFGIQLEKFRSKLPSYAATLGVTASEVASSDADIEYYLEVLLAQESIQDFSESVTSYKNLLRYGNGTEVLGAFPTLPVLPSSPGVGANMQERFSKLVQRIKGSPNYTKNIGEDLGIESNQEIFDPEAGKPVIKTAYSSGGHPVLKWKKGKFQGVEVWKNTGSGWVKLDTDSSPDYTDKTELPPVGQTAVWKYKMIYLYKDAVVGEWSDEVTVTVLGSV